VQLRGLRLELGEVEGVLCGCPLLRRCAVVMLDGVLLAALEPACARLAPPRLAPTARDAAADASHAAGRPPMPASPPGAEGPAAPAPTLLPATALSAACAALVALHASRWLPAAACPRRLDVLEQMPLTPSGKVRVRVS